MPNNNQREDTDAERHYVTAGLSEEAAAVNQSDRLEAVRQERERLERLLRRTNRSMEKAILLRRKKMARELQSTRKELRQAELLASGNPYMNGIVNKRHERNQSRVSTIAFCCPEVELKTSAQFAQSPRLLQEGRGIDKTTRKFAKPFGECTREIELGTSNFTKPSFILP